MARTGFAVGGQIPRRDMIELAQTAEQRGYDTFWLTEGSGKDAFSQIAGLGPVTSRIKLGSGIVILFSRSPSLIAMTTITLDEITSNRFVLGLGTGSPGAQNSHGVPYGRPLGRMRDYVAIIKQALRGEAVAHTGKAYSVNGFRLGFPPPRPDTPIYVAALGATITELAGEIADGVLFYVMTPEAVEDAMHHLKAGAEKAGRKVSDIDAGCLILANPDPDNDRAMSTLKQQIAGFSRSAAYRRLLEESGFSNEMDAAAKALSEGDQKGAAKAISDKMADSLALIGDPSQWGKKIQKYRDAGLDLPIIFPTAAAQGSMELLRKSIIAL